MNDPLASGKRWQAKSKLIVGIAVALLVLALAAQGKGSAAGAAQKPIEERSNTEVVDEVGRLATQGELLTPEGWDRACRFFTKPTPFPGNKVILVVSNELAPVFLLSSKNDEANVGLEYRPMGQIDPELRYTSPPRTDAIKTGFLYHLVGVLYGPDGKTLVDKEPAAYRVWQIQGSPGPPWTTVNTAIRYVLEMRDKTTDPTIKKNADRTLAKLKQLH